MSNMTGLALPSKEKTFHTFTNSCKTTLGVALMSKEDVVMMKVVRLKEEALRKLRKSTKLSKRLL